MAKIAHKDQMKQAARRGTKTDNNPNLWDATVDRVMVAAEIGAKGMLLVFEHPNGQRTTQRV